MAPTEADLAAAAEALRATCAHGLDVPRPLFGLVDDAILAVFDLPSATPSMPCCAPLPPVAYRGLLGSLAPATAAASGVALATAAGGAKVRSYLEVLVVDRSGRIWCSTAPEVVVGLDDLTDEAAALAALLRRRLGLACPPPAAHRAGPAYASEWAASIHRRARRAGAPLDRDAAMALDPCNDPMSDASRRAGPVEAFEALVAGRRDFAIGVPAIGMRYVAAGAFADWFDAGSFAFVLKARAANYVQLLLSLRRCLDGPAYAAVAGAISERGWVPEPQDPVSADLYRALSESRSGPLDAPPIFAAPPLAPLADPVLAGALATFCERAAAWVLPSPASPPPRRQLPAPAVVGAFAWRDRRRPLPPGLYPPLRCGATLYDSATLAEVMADFDAPLDLYKISGWDDIPHPGSPSEVELVDEVFLDPSRPFSGLASWAVPATADGVAVTCYSDLAVRAARADARLRFPDPADWPLVDPVSPDGSPAAAHTLTVAVDRAGRIGYGLFEPDDAEAIESMTDAELAELASTPRPLRVYEVVHLSQLSGEPVARFAAAAALAALGLPLGDQPGPTETLAAYLASVWAIDLADTAAAAGGPLDTAAAAALDPSGSALAGLCRLGWADMPAALAALAGADGPTDRRAGWAARELLALASDVGVDLFGWAVGALAAPRDIVETLVEASCTPLAADAVIETMAARSAFEMSWPETA